MKKFLLFPSLLFISLGCFATANYVYHEQSMNYVATPQCPDNSTNNACGRYVEVADRSGTAGYQVYSNEAYALHFKVEYQFYTNQLRVYYTTDGSTPSAAFGIPNGTTKVVTGSYSCTFSDNTQGCAVVDIASATIPAQPAGTVVKYIVSAYHSGGGDEVFANSGTCAGCTSCLTSACATVYQYNVIPAVILPLQFLNVDGSFSNQKVQLKWTTAEESGISSYDVLRSADGMNFTSIGIVPVMTSSNNASSYFFNDLNPVSGINYYKLKAVALNAAGTFSRVVKVVADKFASSVAAYFNPDHSVLVLKLQTTEPGVYSFRLYDNLGQLLQYSQISHPGGTANHSLDLTKQLSSGIYRISVTGHQVKLNQSVKVD